MDFNKKSDLDELIAKLYQQNDQLGIARNTYLLKEAERKNYEANLIMQAFGKSHAERVVNAQASIAWLTFSRSLARLESEFEFHKLKFEILKLEHQSVYLETKLDSDTLKRG